MNVVIDFYVPVLRCWECGGEGTDCMKCGLTGSFYWADGRTFPFTQEGERQARRAQKTGGSAVTEEDWKMSLQVIEELNANPTADHRVIIADWLRKARESAVASAQRKE